MSELPRQSVDHEPPKGGTQRPAEPAGPLVRPEEVISTDTLDFLVEGVRVRFVPLTAEEQARAKAEGRSGWYTHSVNDPRVSVKEIHYHPDMIGSEPERARATALHEALHHAKPVAALDRRIERLAKRAKPPKAYAETPKLRELFPLAIRTYLGNALTDRFLEFYAVRGNYRRVFLPDYQKKTEQSKDGRDLRQLPLPQQFVQRLLGAERFHGGEPKDTVDPRIEEEFAALEKALTALDDVSTYEHPLRLPGDEQRDIERKAYAVEQFFLPAFIRMLEQEQEDRKKQEEEKKPEGEEKGDKPSPELLQELAEMLEKLIKEGKEQFVPMSEQDPIEQLLQGARAKSNEASKPGDVPGEGEGKDEGKGEPKEGEGKGEGEKGVEERRAEAAAAGRRVQEARGRGTAERHGVAYETVQAYERYREARREEIAKLRDRIIEAMREERQAVLGMTEREGEVTPGLETEAIAAAYAGEMDSTTHLRHIEAPQFTRVRLLFVVDVSGSMSGQRMESARAAYVILSEAFLQAKTQLEEDALVAEDEEPLEIGLLVFEGGQTLAQPIGPPQNEGERYRTLEALTPGGGTNDYAALERAAAEIAKRAQESSEQFINIVAVLTDGEGDTVRVQGFANRVRAEQHFSLVALGFGTSAVAGAYGGRPDGVDAVHGADFADPADAIPAMGAFIGGRIEHELERRGSAR